MYNPRAFLHLRQSDPQGTPLAVDARRQTILASPALGGAALGAAVEARAVASAVATRVPAAG